MLAVTGTERDGDDWCPRGAFGRGGWLVWASSAALRALLGFGSSKLGHSILCSTFLI